MSSKRGTLLLSAAGFVVVAAVVASLFVMGSPSVQRQRRFDEARERDLMMLQSLIDNYARTHDELPVDLATVTQQNAVLTTRDPETGAPYLYEPAEKGHYRLCATFSARSANDDRLALAAIWVHDAGQSCFERRAPIPPQ